MNTYRIHTDDSVAAFTFVEESDINVFDDFLFEDKIVLKNTWREIAVEILKERGKRKVCPLGDFHLMSPIFIISEYAKEFFERELSPDIFEILPVSSPSLSKEYYAFNVIKKLDAVDKKNSKIVYLAAQVFVCKS